MAALVDADADVNARCTGSHTETPLHRAAGSDDVEALDPLLDAGGLERHVGAGSGWRGRRRLAPARERR